LHGADVVYISGISLAILNPEERPAAVELLRRLRPHVGHIAFDPNVRLRLWESTHAAAQITRSAFAVCDIALPSTEDLAWLLEVAEPVRQIDLLLDMGVAEVALTLGADGCSVADGERRAQLPGLEASRVIDTSGAGDAFNGVYLAGRLQGDAPGAAAERALAVASRVVSHAGAIIPASASHPVGSHSVGPHPAGT
jgi:2-dehydro-3-deoxygluconokinase